MKPQGVWRLEPRPSDSPLGLLSVWSLVFDLKLGLPICGSPLVRPPEADLQRVSCASSDR